MAIPILYTFSGIGSGTMAGATFANAPFTVNVPADASMVAPVGTLPPGSTQVNTRPQTATISVDGLPSAVIGFGLTVTLIMDNVHHLYSIAVGLYPDALVVVQNTALQHYNLKASLNPLRGAGPFAPSTKPFPLTTVPQTGIPLTVQFTAIASAQFQATLIA